MRRLFFSFVVAVLAPTFGTGARVPIAGSGQFPMIDLSAQSPQISVDTVAKLLSYRRDKWPFHDIKACFRQSRVQLALRPICWQRLEGYHRLMVQKPRSAFAGFSRSRSR